MRPAWSPSSARTVDAEDLVSERRGRVRVGVGADREERRIAQVQQAGDADDEVQAEGQEHEDAGVREPVHPGVLRLERRRTAARRRSAAGRTPTTAIPTMMVMERWRAPNGCTDPTPGAAGGRGGPGAALMPALPPAGRAGRRAEDQDDHERGEDDRGTPARVARRRPPDLDEPDDEAAQRRANGVADPAEDGRREGLEAGLEAEVEAGHAVLEAVGRRPRRRPARSR